MKRKNLFRWSVVLMVLIALMMGAGTAFAQDGGAAADPAVVEDTVVSLNVMRRRGSPAPRTPPTP